MSQQPVASDFAQWIQLLQTGAGEIEGSLGPRDAQEFEAALREVTIELRDHPENANEAGNSLRQLIDRYEHVNQWLQAKSPQFKRLQNGPDPDPGSLHPTAIPAAAELASQPAPPAESQARAGSGNGRERRPEQAEPEAKRRPEPTERPDAMPKTKSKEPWTPELWIQLFREAFTALLALVIIGFTLYLAVRSFNLAGDPKKIADAKDLLTIMLGIAGVVVGYYFGRVPGDARAAQATSRADTAVRQREQVKAQARSLAGQADDIISVAFSNARGGQPPPDLAAIRALRDELSDLASSAD